jgi:DNA-binding LytR/AlgR family response regulator
MRLIYIEALGEYCQVFVEGRRIIPKMTIKAMEDMLSEKDFIRILTSVIIPLRK